MTSYDEHRTILKSLSARMAALRPANADEGALLAYLAGTLYALRINELTISLKAIEPAVLAAESH